MVGVRPGEVGANRGEGARSALAEAEAVVRKVLEVDDPPGIDSVAHAGLDRQRIRETYWTLRRVYG